MDNGRVREWIGPRIVPVFADEVQWDIDSTYEPLIMVQSQGETFMSRQYVPAGIPLPNTAGDEESNDYWVHMSNWNAQVEYYRQEVLAFDNRIDALEDALPVADFDSTHTIDGRFDTIEADNWVTRDRIANNAVGTNEIENGSITSQKMAASSVDSSAIVDGAILYNDLNQNTKNRMHSRHFICLGDSYGKGLYPTPDGYVRSNYGWLVAMKDLIDNNYSTCSIKTNLNTYSTVAGVTGFTTSDDFLGILQNIATEVVDKEEITDIVVMAGENDKNATQANVESAVIAFMQYALSTFPNAQIRIGVLAVNINDLSNVKRAYRHGAQRYGGEFIDDVWHLFTLKSNVSSDGVHLTNDGYQATYPMAVSAAITGHCSYYYKSTLTLENTMLPSGYEFDGIPRLSYEVSPDIITLEFDDDTAVDCYVMGTFDVDGKEYTSEVASFKTK